MKIIAISGKARHGKTTTANMLKDIMQEDGKKAIVVSYGGYVKYISTAYYGWKGEKDEYGRTLLQNVGDGLRNTVSETIWIDKLMSDIEMICSGYDYILIDDCRYPNEVLIPKSMFDVICIRVIRQDFESDLTEEQLSHQSEIALDNFEFDYTISTGSGVDNLENPVKFIYDKIKAGE